MAETRKLAAILAADVAGYSRLAAADEERTLARLRALRSELAPTMRVHMLVVTPSGFVGASDFARMTITRSAVTSPGFGGLVGVG
jgi:hypothetical protein